MSLSPIPVRALRRWAALVAVLVAALAASGCDVSQFQFRADQRLTITSPAAHTSVHLPMRITWTMRDFTATGLDGRDSKDAGAYAVFLDRPPMKAGASLRSLFSSDSTCAQEKHCPTASDLAAEHVYVTRNTSLTVRYLPVDAAAGDDLHTITIVLLDGTGHRIGESSWYRTFIAKKTT